MGEDVRISHTGDLLRRTMRDHDSGTNPQRSRVTRRIGDDLGQGISEALAWDSDARRQPLVMVIDDSLAVRRVVEISLSRANISAVSYPGGVEAITALWRGEVAPPKVLLLDVGMPRMDGYEVARKLKSNAAFRDIRLFMLTGHDGLIDRARAALLGAGFIAKPFKSGALVATVCDALGVRPPESRLR